MGSLSDFVENEILDHILGVGSWTSPTTVYLALSTADPTDAGSGISEPSGNGYIRKAISFGAASNRVITQDALVQFNEATGPWGTISHYAVFDAESSGNMLAHGTLAASKAVVSGNSPSVASGQVAITVSSGKCSNYLANAILNHIFDNTAYTQPTIYAALVETTEITDSMTGSTIDELDMTSYAREACSAWNTASGGASANTNLIDFGALTGTGETVVAICLTDNATKGAGNVLFYDNTENQAIGDGDTVQIPAGDFDVSID